MVKFGSVVLKNDVYYFYRTAKVLHALDKLFVVVLIFGAKKKVKGFFVIFYLIGNKAIVFLPSF